jgi:hypothetical protein
MLAMIWSPWQTSGKTSSDFAEALGWAGLVALMLFFNKLNEFQPFLYRGGILLTALTSTKWKMSQPWSKLSPGRDILHTASRAG